MTSHNTQSLILAIELAVKGDYRRWSIAATRDPAWLRATLKNTRGWRSWRCCCPGIAGAVLRFFEFRGMRLLDSCDGAGSYVCICVRAVVCQPDFMYIV